jgi:hypothetical protein
LRISLADDFLKRQGRHPLMQLANTRMAASCLICGGLLAVLGSVAGFTSTAALAATGSLCEPLPAAAPSASPSATAPASSQGELCVSVQASGTTVKAGQVASYVVQVSAQNGPASGVSVTLTAAPSGQVATFTSRCPSGNGAAVCTLGSLGGTVAPSSFQMQAQVKVVAGISAGTSVTLTATADAATSPALATLPVAAATTQVVTASPSPSKSPSSTPAVSTPPTQAATVTPPVLASPPTLGAMPPTPAASSPLISPVSVSSAFPEITPPPVTPVAVTAAGSPAADTGTPMAGNFTVQIGMSAATAQLLGFVLLGFVLLLAATKLVNDQLTARRNHRKEPGAKAKKDSEAGQARLGFRRPARLGGPGRQRPRSHRGSQSGGPGGPGIPGPGIPGTGPPGA